MFEVITGNFTLVVPEAVQNFPEANIILSCNTTGGAVNITIPAISTFGNAGFLSTTIKIVDQANNAAANNITVTVEASNSVNNAATFVINQNNGSAVMTAVGLLAWSAVDPLGGMLQVARTSTVAGATTGTILNGNVFVTVTSTGANDIIILPIPVPGTVVRLRNAATGYELRSSDPATIGINGGTGANAESAIAANILVEMVCDSATSWIGSEWTTAGVQSAVQVAAA